MMQSETLPAERNTSEQILESHPLLEVYGLDFADSAARLLETHPEVANAYLTTYERLAMQAGNTAWMFPEKERESARQATIQLFGSTIETVQQHHDLGQLTKTEIDLIGRKPAEIDLYGTEPLMLLDTLTQVYWVAGQVSPERSQSTIRTTQAERGEGYSIYRFIDTAPDPNIPPCASLYIRGEASEILNPHREYGGTHGVEASIALRVDVKLLREYLAGYSKEMIGLGTSKGANDGVVCLRLDRSGVVVELTDGSTRRLPTTFAGTAAHDIGSVLHDDVGKLLSANNATLNHLPLSDELGRADTFAVHATNVEQRITQVGVVSNELRTTLRQQNSRKVVVGALPRFEIGQDPFSIPGVRELATYSGLELAEISNDEQLQTLYKMWGTQKAFQYNAAKLRESVPQLEYSHLLQLLGRTGMMEYMPTRTVYGPVTKHEETDIRAAVVFEGTSPWVGRRANHLLHMMQHGTRFGRVILGATERPLNTPAEVAHPDVIALHRQLQRQPTAVDFMQGPIRNRIQAAGVQDVEIVALPYYQTLPNGSTRITGGGDVARAVMETHPDLADGAVFDALNAPAGGMFYGALKAFLETSPDFTPEQFYFGHGRNRLAATYEDNVTTGLFQNIYTAPSSLVRWLDAIHKINQRFDGISA
jgi:hypothetical protein